MALNKVLLIGNVGKDPEIRHTPNGPAVATITLATSERYRDRTTQEMKEITEWHTIVAWRQLADLAENYIRKGSQIYVEGRLRTRSYDTQDGQKRYVTEILADSIQLLGRRSDGQAPQRTGGAYDDPGARGGRPQPAPVPASGYKAPAQPKAEAPVVAPQVAEDIEFGGGEDDLPF